MQKFDDLRVIACGGTDDYDNFFRGWLSDQQTITMTLYDY